MQRNCVRESPVEREFSKSSKVFALWGSAAENDTIFVAAAEKRWYNMDKPKQETGAAGVAA